MDTAASLSQLSLEYSYTELQTATRNFDESHRLGDGTFGGVFRGIQKDGTEVAVKVLELSEDAGFDEEVKVLSKFRHPNLVILMGFARHDRNSFLVYELLSGGDVYKRLQKSHAEGVPFPWRHRVSVAFDAACGLSHLHNSSPKVFHRDIKSPNILLDRNGTAKMADFGLACLSHTSAHKVKQASGTIGYCCPLYVQRGLVTEGSEVYSFGIVLLELLTARQPAYMAPGPDGQQQYQFLVSYLQGDPHMTVSLADALAQWPQSVAYQVADLALRCIDMTEESRPAFTAIVQALRALRDADSQEPAHNQWSRRRDTDEASAALQQALGQSSPAHLARAPPHQTNPQQAPQYPQQQAMRVPAQQPAPLQQAVLPVGVTPVGVAVAQAAAAAACSQHPPAQPAAQALIGGAPHPAIAAGHMPPVDALAQQQQLQLQQQQKLQLQLQQQQIAQQQQQIRATRPPVLWVLECIMAEGRLIEDLPREQRSLVHHSDGQTVTIQRVGSLFNPEFWQAVLPQEMLSVVSREHIQIWAEEMPSPSGKREAGKVPCQYFLTNFCKHGTVVNGEKLSVGGKQVPLHDGDVIGLTRVLDTGGSIRVFMELRFDLSQSVLTDASVQAALPRAVASQKLVLAQQVIPGMGTSFCGVDMRPMFWLDLFGSAVRHDGPLEERRIVHGCPVDQNGEALLVPSLVLGRSVQPDFWQNIVTQEAFNALSRQHLQLDVLPVRDAHGEGPMVGVPAVYVKNFSEANPISLITSDGEAFAAEGFGETLGVEERRLLRHGMVIELNRSKDNNLKMMFIDARVERPPPGSLLQRGHAC
mmetsp:Transcript_7948/g.17655  ORF Transcript_7948/g.17655 Transcript_7948/m.17655 type:complete len:814 (+) Transcript_7948:96-2537(+)